MQNILIYMHANGLMIKSYKIQQKQKCSILRFRQLLIILQASTQIGSNFHRYLFNLFKIRCLSLGSTRINAQAIQQVCQQFPTIQKLSLYDLRGSAVVIGRCLVTRTRLHRFGQILKQLKYLDISSLDKADDTLFEFFNKIKTVNVWMATGLTSAKKITILIRNQYY